MCLDSGVDNPSSGLDNMNNIKVAPITTLKPQIELSVRLGRIIKTFFTPTTFMFPSGTSGGDVQHVGGNLQ